MNLEKAIEIQTIHNDHNPDFTDAEREQAHQIGLDAMVCIRVLRIIPDKRLNLKLAGETEE